ncbi:MAG: carboxypeptidase-like regulatory domain-containing protein [Armatimonadota bacterium]
MRNLLLALALLLTIVLIGCGGGDNTPVNTDPGAVQGQITGGNPAGYELMLDGQPLSLTPDEQGNFSIPNLPPGNHTIAVIWGGGFSGAHVGFVIAPGQTVDIGGILPQPGGQIVGIVSRSDVNGNLTPLQGAEVIADAEPIYVVEGETGSGAPSSPRDPESLQLRAITDANGSYIIPAVPVGSYVVTVSIPGLVQGMNWVYVSPGTTSAADFQLLQAIEPGVGTVVGTILGVLPNGESQPVEGACVTVNAREIWHPTPPDQPFPLPVEALAKALVPSQATSMMPPLYDFRQFSTLTDSQGRYSLNVPSGYLSLSVWAENYQPAWDDFSLRPGETAERSYTIAYSGPGDVPPPEPLF